MILFKIIIKTDSKKETEGDKGFCFSATVSEEIPEFFFFFPLGFSEFIQKYNLKFTFF